MTEEERKLYVELLTYAGLFVLASIIFPEIMGWLIFAAIVVATIITVAVYAGVLTVEAMRGIIGFIK